MFKRIVITTFLFFLVLSLRSQEVINLSTVDQKTYSLWAQKDWDKLIVEGKKGINKGIDFFYLRMRMGIAYYEKANYHMAIKHFEKAYAMSSQDELLKEYLYYSYLFSGRKTDASKIASGFTHALKEKTGTNNQPFIDRLDLTYNYNFQGDPSVTDNFSAINIDPLVNGSQFISKGHQYFNLSLQHDFSPGFSVYHAYSNLKKTDFVYSQIDGVSETISNSEAQLHQYYISGNIRLSKGLNMALGLHYINLQIPVEKTEFRQGNTYSYIENSSVNDYLLFLTLYKNLNYVTIGAAGYYAELNDNQQLQGDVLITLYPFGNLNLYSVSTFSLQSETYFNNNKVSRLIFDQQIGFKVSRYLWMEGYASFGDMHNLIKADGFVVFNGIGTIKNRYGGRLIIPLKSGFEIRLDYTLYKNESSFTLSDGSMYLNTINYTNHSITGGIKWNF